jgi:hypothetical protein
MAIKVKRTGVGKVGVPGGNSRHHVHELSGLFLSTSSLVDALTGIRSALENIVAATVGRGMNKSRRH